MTMEFNFKETLYARFERYVRVESSSRRDSKSFPSGKGQLKLGEMLLREMRQMGLKNARMDKYGYVTGELPSNTPKKLPVIAFLAHLDTSPDASGENVIPKIHKNYDGKDIVIDKASNVILSPGDSPDLLRCLGDDIVTAGGKTLLGADNKAGIAIILTALEWLIANPGISHGRVKAAFTPDEEIGKGVDHFNVKAFGADYAYTVDGDVTGTVEDENFNADGLSIEIKGKVYHPGMAKNKMLNAARIAADIINSWPENLLPETTENREGFISFMSCDSSVEKASISGIIREHDLKKLKNMEKLLTAIVEEKKVKYPGVCINLKFEEQYRNMKQVLDRSPEVIKHLFSALKSENVEPIMKPIRGGTDGARLSFMGLPTPNIFTGGSNFHGKYEWASLDGMEKSSRVLISLIREWAK